MNNLYERKDIFFKPWHEVSRCTEESASPMYTFVGTACYIENLWSIIPYIINIFKDHKYKDIKKGEKREEITYSVALEMAINELELEPEAAVQPIYRKVKAAICRCKICKSWLNNNITGIGKHLWDRHQQFFRHDASEEWRQIIVKYHKLYTWELINKKHVTDERFQNLQQLTLSYFPMMTSNAEHRELFDRCKQIPKSLDQVDEKYKHCAHDFLVRFAPVMGITPTRSQNYGLASMITVKC